MRIERADFADPALATFLEAHHTDIAPTAPPESQHALDIRELQLPTVRMWAASDGGRLVGTVALASLDSGHEELKSMRTDPAVRGRGIASELVRHALADARGRGVTRVSLETGSQDFFLASRALYRKFGFVACEPFGTYEQDPNSVFMTLVI